MSGQSKAAELLPFRQGSATLDKVPLLDVGRGNSPLREELLAAIAQVIDSGKFLHGPEVTALENSVAGLCGVEHAIGCASGSDALLLALMALDVGPGDEVIVPSFTFFATASAVWRLGAKPVFVDIEADSFNIDPAKIPGAITKATRAIIPVHLFGQCAEMDPILDIARRYKLHVIEDAAQAIGATYHGRSAGSLGTMGCLSFYPTKNLGGFGDGGMLITNNTEFADRLRLLAAHGMSPRYYHRHVGINSRLDTLQAAVLGVKLKYLAEWTVARSANAARYWQLLSAAGVDRSARLPQAGAGQGHVWNQYTLRIDGSRRDEVKSHLAQHGVGAEIYYPVPLHRQECFASLGYAEGSLPVTEQAAHEVLSLPIFPELTDAELQTVVARLAEAFGEKRSAKAA